MVSPKLERSRRATTSRCALRSSFLRSISSSGWPGGHLTPPRVCEVPNDRLRQVPRSRPGMYAHRHRSDVLRIVEYFRSASPVRILPSRPSAFGAFQKLMLRRKCSCWVNRGLLGCSKWPAGSSRKSSDAGGFFAWCEILKSSVFRGKNVRSRVNVPTRAQTRACVAAQAAMEKGKVGGFCCPAPRRKPQLRFAYWIFRGTPSDGAFRWGASVARRPPGRA